MSMFTSRKPFYQSGRDFPTNKYPIQSVAVTGRFVHLYTSHIWLPEVAPATDMAGFAQVYVKTDKHLYYKYNGVTEVQLDGGSIPWTAIPSTIKPSVDNTYDIGGIGSPNYRWQTIYAMSASFGVATGTPPLLIASTTLCSNLNADLLDGYHVGTSGSDTGYLPYLNSGITWANLNAGYATTAAYAATTGDAVKKDGTTPLTDNWSAGNYVITAEGFRVYSSDAEIGASIYPFYTGYFNRIAGFTAIGSITPSVANTYACGNYISGLCAWSAVTAVLGDFYALYYHTITPYDDYDDLALLRKMRPRAGSKHLDIRDIPDIITGKAFRSDNLRHHHEVLDRQKIHRIGEAQKYLSGVDLDRAISSIEDEISTMRANPAIPDDSAINLAALSGLLIGAINQLVDRLELVETKVKWI